MTTAPLSNDARAIEELRSKLGGRLTIVGHHYEQEATIQHCDIRGDSLELARRVPGIASDYIVFCGVYFMAESAALLAREGQQVLLPDHSADCVMAQMTPARLLDRVLGRLTASGRKLVPLAYVNTSLAVKAVVGAVSRIRDTASAHDRAAIIEVMGRFAGNIALDAGIACGAEYILVPEVPFSREKLARSLIGQMKEGRTNSIIICAEGADDGRALGDWLKERTNIDICTTILGFIQRGGRPSARDSILGSLLGAAAVKALLDGQITSLIGMNKGEIRILPYSEAAKEKKIFKKGLYTLAGILGAAQEDGDIAESGL